MPPHSITFARWKALVAQSVKRWTCDLKIANSNPGACDASLTLGKIFTSLFSLEQFWGALVNQLV